jgi:hypothetical protein
VLECHRLWVERMGLKTPDRPRKGRSQTCKRQHHKGSCRPEAIQVRIFSGRHLPNLEVPVVTSGDVAIFLHTSLFVDCLSLQRAQQEIVSEMPNHHPQTGVGQLATLQTER